MNNKEKKQQNQNDKNPNWKEIAMGFLGAFAKDITEGLVEEARYRARLVSKSTRKTLVGGLAMLIGAFLALWGISIWLAYILNLAEGVGYILTGIVVVLTGYLIIKQ